MNKAFTKEDDDTGFAPPSASRPAAGVRPFHLTARGARELEEKDAPRLREMLARAEVLPPAPDPPDRAALGVTVRVRTSNDEEKRYRLVSPEERALLGDGCSVQSPIGRALLGAAVGDVREYDAPRGAEELLVVALEGER